MKKLLSMMFALTLVVFMSSCSEDNGTDPDPVVEKTYFPMTDGDSWIYNYTKLNQSQEPIADTETTDTVRITGTETYLGKLCSVFELVSSDGTKRSTHMYKEGKKLYTSVFYILPMGDDLGPFGDLPIFPEEESWVLLADPDQSKWDIMTLPIDNYDLDYNGTTITVNGNFSYSVEKGSKTEWVINEKKTNVQEYKVIYQFVGKISILSKTITLTNHYWFAEGIGLVKRQLDPTKVDLYGFSSIDIDGNRSEIDAYNVTEE